VFGARGVFAENPWAATLIHAMLVLLGLLGEGVPPELASATVSAAIRYEVDPATLGGYLLSEHADGGPFDSGRCSDAGACGPFQLAAMWGRRFDADREDPREAADATAQLIRYSIDRHRRKCRGSNHEWRAHLKCARADRDSDACSRSVGVWLARERGF